jgi:hypothetical protein
MVSTIKQGEKREVYEKRHREQGRKWCGMWERIKNKSSKHYNVVVYKYKTNVKSIGVNKKKSQSGMDKTTLTRQKN